jgi:K+-transporting ATPase KdpF subunit
MKRCGNGSFVFGDSRRLLSIEWSARDGMSSPLKEEMMDAMQLLAAVLAGGLFVYLLFAMLCPEKFS